MRAAEGAPGSNDERLSLLLTGPRLAGPAIHVPETPGAYVLWLNLRTPVCLKVGISENLRRRIRFHVRQDERNTVLARHLIAAPPPGAWKYDFNNRSERQLFLQRECSFQAIQLSDLTREALGEFESFLEEHLQPKYRGKVGKREEG